MTTSTTNLFTTITFYQYTYVYKKLFYVLNVYLKNIKCNTKSNQNKLFKLLQNNAVLLQINMNKNNNN